VTRHGPAPRGVISCPGRGRQSSAADYSRGVLASRRTRPARLAKEITSAIVGRRATRGLPAEAFTNLVQVVVVRSHAVAAITIQVPPHAYPQVTALPERTWVARCVNISTREESSTAATPQRRARPRIACAAAAEVTVAGFTVVHGRVRTTGSCRAPGPSRPARAVSRRARLYADPARYRRVPVILFATLYSVVPEVT
jgi:hypothetical protein